MVRTLWGELAWQLGDAEAFARGRASRRPCSGALLRLATVATYLYEDNARYWYATQPTVTKLAEDRADQMRRNRDRIEQKIGERMRTDLRQFGDFSRVHAWPHAGHDVPDDPDARLVVLGIEHPYGRGGESAAEQQAQEILETRGTTPRIYRNALVFLAADATRLPELEEAVRRFLAWESIVAERELLNLAPQQVRQAETRREAAAAEADSRIPETCRWLPDGFPDHVVRTVNENSGTLKFTAHGFEHE